MTAGPLTIGVVAGEESGDLLASDLVAALKVSSGREVRLVGVGGPHLQALGLQPLFDSSEIALMGVSAIVRDLPRLMRRIGETARALAAADLDCLVTVDSPEFSLRVASKVRALKPGLPIVHYVCPSVWAWREKRAPAMRAHVDHVLCLLPFEPAELARLEGPPGTFVGHRLLHEPGVAAAHAAQKGRAPSPNPADRTLLLLPGSRRGEVRGLIDIFGETVDIMAARGIAPNLILPTTPRLRDEVERRTAGWTRRPRIVSEPSEKWIAFAQADAALIASGTVSLELALCGVPAVSCYPLDVIMRIVQHRIRVWSALLPNLIADRPIVPEFYSGFLRASTLARNVESILEPTALRQWQIDGFAEVRRRMETKTPAGEIAAGVVMDLITRKAR